jgi:hypothetical protein
MPYQRQSKYRGYRDLIRHDWRFLCRCVTDVRDFLSYNGLWVSRKVHNREVARLRSQVSDIAHQLGEQRRRNKNLLDELHTQLESTDRAMVKAFTAHADPVDSELLMYRQAIEFRLPPVSYRLDLYDLYRGGFGPESVSHLSENMAKAMAAHIKPQLEEILHKYDKRIKSK